MALYMYQAAYTAESMAAQINEPQDRIEAVRPALEAMGATIIAGGYPFGEFDVLVVYEAADDTTAAGFAMAVAAGGAVKSAKTTRLLNGQEWIESLRKAHGSQFRRLEDATLPGRDDVQSQLDALTAGHDVDDELAQMKAQLAASAAPQAVEGPGTASADPGRVARDVPAGRAGQRAALGDAVPAGTPKCLPRVRSRSFGTVICYGCPSSTGHACR